MMLRVEVTGDSPERAQKILDGTLMRAFRVRLQEAMNEAADQIAAGIRQVIDTRGESVGAPFTPNAPLTIALKGSDQPLVDTGEYQDSIISVHGSGQLGAFAGVDPDGRHHSGESLTTIGALNEFGGLVLIGERMVLVPPRPHMRPAVESLKPTMVELVEGAMEDALEDIE